MSLYLPVVIIYYFVINSSSRTTGNRSGIFITDNCWYEDHFTVRIKWWKACCRGMFFSAYYQFFRQTDYEIMSIWFFFKFIISWLSVILIIRFPILLAKCLSSSWNPVKYYLSMVNFFVYAYYRWSLRRYCRDTLVDTSTKFVFDLVMTSMLYLESPSGSTTSYH